MRNITLTAALVLLAACDKTGAYLVPQPTEGLDPVLEIGELPVLTQAEWNDEYTRHEVVTYADIGAPLPGDASGATFTFTGTGDKVCIVMDPESVFWNTSVATNGANEVYSYSDNYLDDGDLDMSAGFSANYTGSPGIELGDFYGLYTDSLGNTVEIEYNLCENVDYYGDSPAYAGKAGTEYCEIDTEGREGIEYTVLLKTFSIPIDDSILSFATAVYDGSCRNIDECTLRYESRTVWVEDDGTIMAETREGFEDLEQAYCDGDMLSYCTAHPEMCGKPPE
jgi:hypothetical protein